jgi:hypothetical protein
MPLQRTELRMVGRTRTPISLPVLARMVVCEVAEGEWTDDFG